MRWFLFIGIIIAGITFSGFVKQPEISTNEKGCAGSGCHSFEANLMKAKSTGNLSIRVTPKTPPGEHAISAALLDQQGRMVDFMQSAGKRGLRLNAPNAGRYKLLYATKHKTAVWDTTWIDVTKPAISIPVSRFGTSKFEFFPIHPNPTSGAAVVRFNLPTNTDVELTLFTLGSKKVRDIYSGQMDRGLQEVYWETRDNLKRPLEPGTYLCQLKTGIKTVVQKIEIQ